MKTFLILAIILSVAHSKSINFNAFKVDTSVSDIKPVKKEVVPEKFDKYKITSKGNSFSISSDTTNYRPRSYNPMINPHVKPNSDFGTTQIEKMNQNARGMNPNM